MGRKLPACIVVCVLGGCTVGPNYKPPVVEVGPEFGELGQTTSANPASQPSRGVAATPPVVEWWRTFRDPELDDLVDQAVNSNLDMQIATARVLESRAQRNITGADLFPEVNATGGFTHAKGSKNVTLPLGSSGSGGSSQASAAGARAPLAARPGEPADPPLAASNSAPQPASPFGEGGLPGVTTDLYQVGFDASWELDVFGGTRRRIEAANATLGAAIEDRRDAMVSLLAEVARDYLMLRGSQRRLAVARENLAAERETMEVIQSQRKAGLATELDVTRAAAQVAETTASIPPLEARIRVSIHALGVLLAKDPDALGGELEAAAPLPAAPPEVPIGLPSELLRRRPDVRRAERQLAAATAQIGAATADLFPKFALTGSAGLDSSHISNLLDWPSNYFLISPTISWPVFDAGRIVSNISLQKAGQREALLAYRQSVLAALKDVEDALVNYATEQARHAALAESVNQSRQSLDIAREQYRQGLVDFLNVLDAQRTLLAGQDALAQSDQTELTNLVALYKSLGGGWQVKLP